MRTPQLTFLLGSVLLLSACGSGPAVVGGSSADAGLDLPAVPLDTAAPPDTSAADVGSDAADAPGEAGPPPTCEARCVGRLCGDDGCGGLCGTCRVWQTCTAGRCVLNDDACEPGATRVCYTGPGSTAGVGRCRAGRQVCEPFGLWETGCTDEVRPAADLCGNDVDDDCDGVADEGCAVFATRELRGTVRFERRRPNAGRTDWGDLEEMPAVGFAVYAMRGESVVSASVTRASTGEFTVRVPDPALPDDRVVVATIAEDGRGAIDYAIASPELATGAWPAFSRSRTAPPRVWSWSWRMADLPADAALRIDEAAGSGIANVFDVARRTLETARTLYPTRPRSSLLLWLQPGVDWSCGACFTFQSRDVFEQSFSSQIAYPGGPNGQWWSDAVIAHEVGHYVMETYGVSPREGGPHTVNQALAPGLAWSEGYATWFSSVVRGDPVYLDRQGGSTFWIDIAARRYATGGVVRSNWTRTDLLSGLLQGISETEVSAMLWALAPDGSRDPLHAAFVSPHMSAPPFARAYVSGLGGNVPVLPDFFDALLCDGFPAARVAAVVAGAYPYPTDAPRCRAAAAMNMTAPLAVSWRVEGEPARAPDGSMRARVVARIEQRAGLPTPLLVRVEAPPGVVVHGGPKRWTLAATGAGGVYEARFEVVYQAQLTGALTLTADARDAAMGAHGEARWRFGEPEPAGVQPRVGSLRLRRGGRDLGPSVEMAAPVQAPPRGRGRL